MSNFYSAFLSDSDSEGGAGAGKGGATKSKAKTTSKPTNPAVALAKSRNPDSKPTPKPKSTGAGEKTQSQTQTTAANKTTNTPNNNRQRTNTNRNQEAAKLNEMNATAGAGGPTAGSMRDREKDLHQRDYRNSHNTRGGSHTRGTGRGGRGGYRGGRGGASGAAGGGGGAAGGGGRPPRREFDRRSGTGRGREMKKDGHGAHNWGNAAEDQAAEETLAKQQLENTGAEPNANAPDTAKTDENAVDGEAPVADGENPPAEGEEVEKEDEKPEFTLDEFMSQRNGKRTGVGFEDLEEVEVEDIQDGRAYAKKDAKEIDTTDAYFVAGSGNEKKSVPKKGGKKQKEKKAFVDTGFTVRNPDDERGPSGFRGRGRGRGRGSPSRGGARPYGERRYNNRGGYGGNQGSAVDTSENNFPSLGA